jgi:glyoxylase-like metal-dependent hydrolase (beta-lactamase superfamily II)
MSALPPIKKFLSNSGVRIYRIPCQVLETLSARVYLLVGAGPPTLVDAGSGLGSSTRHILAGIEAVRDDFGEDVRPGDVRRILITHGHVDHVGGLPELLRIMPALVAIHPLDRAAIASHREYATIGAIRLNGFLCRAGVDPAQCANLLKVSPYRWTSHEGDCPNSRVGENGTVPFDARGDVSVTLALEDGDELDGLHILHTPGHSPGHVCIGVGNVLLAGDHILSQTLPQQWPESILAYSGLGHYLESLDKVQHTPGFVIALAAHEQPIRDVYHRIDTMRSAHRRRLQRLLEMPRKAGCPLSLHEIARQSYPEITGFRALLAITDIGSRVEYLHQRGRLTVANLDEIERDDAAAFLYRAV